jgi:hypothetical protein
MLSDVGSFLMEYLVTEKPVLYLENKDGLGLNEVGQALVPLYDSASNFDELCTFLDCVATGKDPRYARRVSAIAQFFPYLDGLAGRRALNHLDSLMRPG